MLLPVFYLSRKALARKPHPPCCLSVLHLALRAPAACRVAKKRNSPQEGEAKASGSPPKTSCSWPGLGQIIHLPEEEGNIEKQIGH